MSQDPATSPAPESTAPYGAGPPPAGGPKRIRIPHLQAMTDRGERWAMLTSYDMATAAIFDEAGIPVLLVGDSAGNNVYGFETTVPVTLEHMVPLVRAVSGAVRRALVVADLPFGTYEAGPEQALASATRLMKEGLAHAVKLEGGTEVVPQVETLVRAGIPVMGHVGFTPQSEHTLGGYRVQGRGEAAQRLVADARALEEAGCFAVVLEMVPAPAAQAGYPVSIDTAYGGITVEVHRAANPGAPFLYLLDGVGSELPSGFMQWGAAEQFADQNVNLIIPTGGQGSMWSDWNAPDPVLGMNDQITGVQGERVDALA